MLYLLHGYGQLTSSWTETGFANVILDHLIDEGKAKPMIVVIPLANGGSEIITGGHKAFQNDTLRMKNFDKFTADLLYRSDSTSGTRVPREKRPRCASPCGALHGRGRIVTHRTEPPG